MEKSKTSQKGAGKQQQQQQQQQRPGTEQVRSGSHIQKGESEKIQQPKHQQKVKK
jgi:hypothetical protein